ncbi:carbohydrate ABC transporter permease [Jiangella alkaliphila]|uniref:Multiple sugar transport system permease protein n=1 Tax=Jiangella alkaliphila TaxID=419479 RepID=A0A1H2KJ29_9ACTN|nr:carbohydrate ABC transporter permease [Jiangella alkaliphila]SDU68426.1 multiple sugar transport system permease protein [Jiangella alkaliphila]
MRGTTPVLRRVVLAVLLIGLAVVMLTPLVFGFLASVSPLRQIVSSDPGLLPDSWDWSNYADAWTRADFARYFLNSVVVTLVVVVVDTLASSMTGYVLARKHLPGQRFLEIVFMLTLFIGLTTAMLYPQYQIARSLGIANLLGVSMVEYAGIMIIHVYLIKAFVQGMGIEVEDAARVDGCGFFGTYRRIALPLMTPILVTTVVLGVQASWNNYQVPLVFSLAEADLRTLIVGVSALQYDAVEGMSAYNTVLAGATMALVPIIVVFVVLQRFFVRGWTEGAVKG